MTSRCSAIFGEEFTVHELDIHRENPERIRRVISCLPDYISHIRPVTASFADLERVHHRGHIRMIEYFSSFDGIHYIDMDTYVNKGSFETALLAAGSSILAAERALDGEHCFALVRPPGHHAEPDRAMGFCLFNNAAVAAAWALEQVDRVAILDWDLHHGNGTQKIFYKSDRVLFCSVHMRNAFPGTGWIDEIGEERGMGFTLNAPLQQGCGIDDYACLFTRVFAEALGHFKPDLLIISAGQDTLGDDPMNGMRLAPQDFRVLTRILMEAVDQPLALVLEGGYGPSLGEAVAEIFGALHDEPVKMPSGTPRESTLRTVAQLEKVMI
ncbi:MAG: histone deacetylase [Methanoregulaceae archaeon]